MPRPSIYRPRALERRALGIQRPPPRPPVPSVRAVWLLWVLLAVALGGLVAVGHTLERQLAMPADRVAAPSEAP